MRTDVHVDGRQVNCAKHAKRLCTLGFGQWRARVGDWIQWRYPEDTETHVGRMIGHIAHVPRLTAEDRPYPHGVLVVLELSLTHFSCFERWIDPADVVQINQPAPDIAEFLAWFAGEEFGTLAKKDRDSLRGVVNYGSAGANLAIDRPEWSGKIRRDRYFAERARRIAEHGDIARSFGMGDR